MRIEADRERCIGAGMCALTAPHLFDQDEDDGTVVVLDSEPSDEAKAREAVSRCPSTAVWIAAP